MGAKERPGCYCEDRGKEGEFETPEAGPAVKSNVLSNYGLIFLPWVCLKRIWRQEQAIKQLKLLIEKHNLITDFFLNPWKIAQI